MQYSLFIRAILLWISFIPIAITNGIVREKFYKQYVGDLTAHQISTFIAIIAFLTVSYFVFRKQIQTTDTITLLAVGLMMVLMTIAFEFGFGHYVDKAPWEKLFADYNIIKGRLWGVFLFIVLFVPLIVQKIVNWL